MADLNALRMPVQSFQLALWDGERLEPHLTRLGINFMSLTALYQGGVLSFAPELDMELSPAIMAELEFLAPFIRMQLDVPALKLLLANLNPPFNYDHRLIYLDWPRNEWRPYPVFDWQVQHMSEHMFECYQQQDLDALKKIHHQLLNLLEDVEYRIIRIQEESTNS